MNKLLELNNVSPFEISLLQLPIKVLHASDHPNPNPNRNSDPNPDPSPNPNPNPNPKP